MSGFVNSRTGAFLKLVRFENLLMIALTQVLLRYFVLKKVLYIHGIEPLLSDGLFFLVVLSTVLIAAAGYIINDYFDVKTDTINHPDTVVVDRLIDRRLAIILHITLTALGIMMGIYAAWMTGYLRLAFFHFAAAILLWFYSTDFKKKLVIGNVVVALLTASVTFMPFIYEMGVMQKVTPDFFYSYRHAVLSSLKYAWIFSVFAFITTLAREIIKDMEDYKGDKATGGHTLPIVWGFSAGRITAFFLLLITAILLLFVIYNTVRFERVIFSLSNVYIICMLIVPLLALAVYTLRSTTSRQFHRASVVLKLIMLTGLCYSFIFFYH
jgi:4-hydroxybenzoate polyprenyltransferase